MEKWGVTQADRYYNLIIDEIEFIAQNFESGKLIEYIRKGYRSTKVKSHVILYRKVGVKNIEVIRILHQQMDIENRLKD